MNNNNQNQSVIKPLENYIRGISAKYKYESTSEMGYRTEFEILVNYHGLKSVAC